MPLLGVLRYGVLCDNDYFLLARDSDGNALRDVAVFHRSDSFAPWPSKTVYPAAELSPEGNVLYASNAHMCTPAGRGVAFSANGPFDFRTITPEQYEAIVEHTDDIGYLVRDHPPAHVERYREHLAEYDERYPGPRVELERILALAPAIGIPLGTSNYAINAEPRVITP